MSIENYKKVISDGILSKNVLAIFPNVEMRIMPTGKKSPVNMHFIFNPDFVDQLENRFFSQLEFVEERKYHAIKTDLIELGKKMGMEDEEEDIQNFSTKKIRKIIADLLNISKDCVSVNEIPTVDNDKPMNIQLLDENGEDLLSGGTVGDVKIGM